MGGPTPTVVCPSVRRGPWIHGQGRDVSAMGSHSWEPFHLDCARYFPLTVGGGGVWMRCGVTLGPLVRGAAGTWGRRALEVMPRPPQDQWSA